MNESDGQEAGGLNPQALRLEDVARILSALWPKPTTVAMLQADLDAGAPSNPDGTINLMHYAAWLVQGRMGRGA